MKFSLGNLKNALGQVFHGGQHSDLVHHVAKGSAVQFHGKGDIPVPVKPVDLRCAAAHADIGQRGQSDHTVLARHTYLSDPVDVVSDAGVHLDTDRDLALGKVEFVEARRVISVSGQANGVRQSFHGHAKLRGLGVIGIDLDFRPLERRSRTHMAHTFQCPHVIFKVRGGGFQEIGIVSCKGDFQLFAVSSPAHGDLGSRQFIQKHSDFFFHGHLLFPLVSGFHVHSEGCSVHRRAG